MATIKRRSSSKRASLSEPNEDNGLIKSKHRSSTIDLLQKIFPKLKVPSLEQTLQRCNDDVLKTIEHLIKESQENESNSESELIKSEIAVKVPVETDFSEIRKQFGFNKKKPKNSFVRHKANYEKALREQASGSNLEHPAPMSFEATIGRVELANQFNVKSVPQPLSHGSCAPQQLLSMFANSGATSSSPTNSNGIIQPFGQIFAESPSSRSSPPNLLSTSTRSASSISISSGTNLNNISPQLHRNMMNAHRGLLLNPPLTMHNTSPIVNNNTKVEPDSKIMGHSNSFGPQHHHGGPNTGVAASLPHLSRNLFDSLVASTGYRSLFPAFFPGSTPNLTSLGLLGAGLTGMNNNSGSSSNNNNEQPIGALLPGGAMPMNNFEQNFEEFSQKLLNQRSHQIETALHNMCGDNGWYSMGNDLVRNHSNGSSQSKCEQDKNDSH